MKPSEADTEVVSSRSRWLLGLIMLRILFTSLDIIYSGFSLIRRVYYLTLVILQPFCVR